MKKRIGDALSFGAVLAVIIIWIIILAPLWVMMTVESIGLPCRRSRRPRREGS